MWHSAVWHTHRPWQSSTSLDGGIRVGHYAGQFIGNIPGFRWYRKWCRVIKIYTRSSRTIPSLWSTYKVVNSAWLAWIIDRGTQTVALGHFFLGLLSVIQFYSPRKNIFLLWKSLSWDVCMVCYSDWWDFQWSGSIVSCMFCFARLYILNDLEISLF